LLPAGLRETCVDRNFRIGPEFG